MKEGKISSEQLNTLVFDKITKINNDILIRPGVGEDCTAIDFGDYACVMSTDPITGADVGIGKLAVHISCNDIASSGVRPTGIMITILLPTSSCEEDINRIMEEIASTAKELEVDIIGGHTEITSAVNRTVISTTAIGKILKEKLVTSSGAKLGDDVVMTKWAGLEGTAILGNDRHQLLTNRLKIEDIESAKKLIEYISVVKEGIIAGRFGVNSMHDVTEGGILGAGWEIAESSNLGIEIQEDQIPVKNVTKEICKIFNINPYRLISSGSMVITTNKGKELVELFEKNNIHSKIIGKITERERCIYRNQRKYKLEPPDTDELFKI